MSKDTGGPAFPTLEDCYQEFNASPGMTLRDYFAAKAMQQLITLGGCYSSENVEQDCAVAYEIADAMLKERQA